ncbi:MAG: HlyC/CorC family transporter [Hyphomicrobiales bacterium]|nr:HlyC/CorC family transporter [Hyphomicrobiales bacterium]
MSDSNNDKAPPARAGLIERVRHVLGMSPASLRDDIEDALEQPERADDFSPQERSILRNVLSLHEHRVHDVMVPRADIIAIAISASLADVLSVFRTAGHSRLPVHGETLDDPRGMIHIRDFVDFVASLVESRTRDRRGAPDAAVVDQRVEGLAALGALDLSSSLAKAGIIRPVLFVPPSMPALDLLVKMQASRTHMALVIDEYGGTDGLVSIEDVVEMIVGDIEDEHDTDDEPVIARISDGEFLIDARAGLPAVLKETGLALPSSPDADIETIGGFIVTAAGRVPARGEIIRCPGAPAEFEVVDADPRRISTVRLRLLHADSPGEGSEQAADARD